MPSLTKPLLEQRIADADRHVARLKLRLEQQLIHLSELSQDPHEAKRARATADHWLAELSLLRRQRLGLYQQLAFSG
jgi:hypothetical protein